MENYKKISFFLLLSTTLAINAFNPYDTSGEPSLDDIDDWGRNRPQIPLSRTSLEKEVEKQTSAPVKKPAAQSIPVPKPSKKESAKKPQEEMFKEIAECLQSTLSSLSLEFKKQGEDLDQKAKDAKATYAVALAEITGEKNFKRSEKIGGGLAIFSEAVSLIKDNADDAKIFMGIAIIAGVATAWSYIPRYRKAQGELQKIDVALATELEKIVATSRTSTNEITSKLFEKAKAQLAELKKLNVPGAQDVIVHFEAQLNILES